MGEAPTPTQTCSLELSQIAHEAPLLRCDPGQTSSPTPPMPSCCLNLGAFVWEIRVVHSDWFLSSILIVTHNSGGLFLSTPGDITEVLGFVYKLNVVTADIG